MKNTKITYQAPLIFDLASRGRMQEGTLDNCQAGSVAGGGAPNNDCLFSGASAADSCVANGTSAAGAQQNPSCVSTGASAVGCGTGSTP